MIINEIEISYTETRGQDIGRPMLLRIPVSSLLKFGASLEEYVINLKHKELNVKHWIS